MAGKKITIPIEQVTVGVTCSEPILSESGILLIGAKTRITQRLLDGLRDRGLDSIQINPDDLRKEKRSPKQKNTPPKSRGDLPWGPSVPMKRYLVDRHEENLDEKRSQTLNRQLGQAKRGYKDIEQQLRMETLRSVTEIIEIVEMYAHSMVDDHDQTIGTVGSAINAWIPSERGIRMAVMGMAVAIEMGLDGRRTLEVGLTGALHDLGLSVMYPGFDGFAPCMSANDWWEYQKHPLVSAACVKDLVEVSPNVLLAIEQVHEQYDGSGFPRGTGGNRIHTFARIINVVDAYLRLVDGDLNRSAIVPHDALGVLLHQAARGVFDGAVIKAFLRAETMFPLGSFVELSNGERAQVIRRPRKGFSAPILIDDQGQRIEYQQKGWEIICPTLGDNTYQTRISQKSMREMVWNPADSFAHA